MGSPLSWPLIQESLWPLLEALVTGTIPLTLITFALGLALALVLALARISKIWPLRWIAAIYISLFRGTPLLVQLFLIFYGLPAIGILFDPWTSAIIGFSLNVAAYAAESIRGAILSVPKAQWEAASTVGLTHTQTLFRIILPQAARVAIPPLSNTLISLVKDTSLASTVLVTEIFRKAQEIAAPTFEFFTLYGLAAVYYWVVSQILTVLQQLLEKKLSKQVAR